MTTGWRKKKFTTVQKARLIGVVVSCCLIWLSSSPPSLLEDLQLKSFDLLQQLRDFPLANPPVLIVDIDVKSLKDSTLGQWPWSRRKIAALISKIAAAEPKVIGLDIIFAESDRTSPRRVLTDIDAPELVKKYVDVLPDYDNIFADTLKASSVPIVLGHLFTYYNSETVPKSKATHPQRGSFAFVDQNPVPFLQRFDHADLNLPLLENATKHSGFFNIVPDDDAIVRRLPLLASLEQEPWPDFTFALLEATRRLRRSLPVLTAFEQVLHSGLFFAALQNTYVVLSSSTLLTGQAYPSLVLAMLQAANDDALIIVTSNRKNGVRTIQVGPYQIPVSSQGEMIVTFSEHSPYADSFYPERRLQYLSATDILHDKFDPNIFKKAYVLVGTSALGLFDLIGVPESTTFPGVEFHGQALNTILTGNFLERPKPIINIETFQIACAGLLLTLFLPQIGATKGAFLACGIMIVNLVISYGNFLFFDRLADLFTPALATWLLFSLLTFYNYFAEERTAKRLRSTFSQYLAPAVVEEMVRNQDSVVLNGVEREVTILFSDIRGFTSMAEKMRPEALCTFLNEYLTPMTAAIMEQRGTVDKFIGDAVMAFWNAPLPTANHPYHACETALSMLNRLEQLNLSWRERGLPTLHIGIGIHCGLARVGNMGSKQRFEYTVIGDSVNLASRLEGLTKLYGGDILVSEQICDALHKDFLFRQVDTVRVLGKTEPVTVCQLLGKRHQEEKHIETELRCWHKAFAYYKDGNFKAAGLLLRHLSEEQPGDKLYEIYAKRCQQFVGNPPEHWDGITDLRSK